MSKRINLDREVTSCDDCEIYMDCTLKQSYLHNCPRDVMRKNFKKIYEDDVEEADDL
jgi:hypothetical protein